MNHSLKILALCLLPFGQSMAQSSVNQLSHKSLHEDGCITPDSSSTSQHTILNNLRKQVQFLNADNTTFSLEQRMKALNVSAVSIAVIKNNKIDWSSAHGVTTAGTSAKVTCRTVFQAASLSKPIAMMGALKMAEKGVIDLDKNIQSYLTDFQLPQGKQTSDNPVTFRNILNHTSGLNSGGYWGYGQDEAIPSDLDIVKGVTPTNSDPLAVLAPPATQLRYSGAGYTLAEIAMQDIFKQPFESIMKQWIIKPSNMTTADFTQPVNRQKHQSIAHGHQANGITVKGGWRNHPEQAAAGLWTNANDLALFLSEISKGYRGNSAVFSKNVINELFTQEIENHFYGFRTLATGDNLAIAHYGGTQGYRSAMVLDVTTGNGAVVLTNSNDGSLLTGDILRSVAKHYQWPYLNAIFVNRNLINKSSQQFFIGQYEFKKQNWKIDVIYNEHTNKLSIIFPNKDNYPLTATDKTTHHFIHEDTGVEAEFLNSNGNVEITLYGQTGIRVSK